MPPSHGNGCACQNEPSVVPGTEWLDKWIDQDNVEAIGQVVECSSRLFRSHGDRLNGVSVCCSGQDEDGLIISVPFTCPVKLTGIIVIGGENGKSPSLVQLFSNLQDLICATEIEPTQIVENMVEDFCGVIEYPLRPARFAQVNSVTIRFPQQEKEVYWIGLRGIASGDQRKAVVTVYESRANLADHDKLKDHSAVGRHVA